MNKNMFWAGFSIILLELLGILSYLFSSLDWGWFTIDIFYIGLTMFIFISLNIIAVFFMILGAIEPQEKR